MYYSMLFAVRGNGWECCKTLPFIKRLGRSQPHSWEKTKKQQLQAHSELW